MEDHGEVVEWLELVCMCANVLCWFSLQSATLLIKGTPQVVQVGALKPTTQPKQLARAEIARVQMSNAPAVAKPRGSRMGSLVGSRHPLS